jgi:hypothetical protein
MLKVFGIFIAADYAVDPLGESIGEPKFGAAFFVGVLLLHQIYLVEL